MESEKVKEIKKALECCRDLKTPCRDCPYHDRNECIEELNCDMGDYINELESENETIKLNIQETEKASFNINQMNGNLVIENQQLKDRIAELEEDKEKWQRKASRLQDDIETETLYEKDVVCPYCGYHIEDNDYWFLDEEDGEYACPECEKTFTFQAYREITYCTQRKERLS